ncbi:M16 family metallopeptidase [Candidatus Latescibacterota bacterium]
MKVIASLPFLLMIGGVLMISCSGDDASAPTTIASADSAIAPFTIQTLPNGLDVIVKEAHAAPIVAVYLWCKTGSVNETPREEGISHFYEHMFFKGTEKRGVGEIDRAIKSLGGYNNAFTSKEYTAYYVVLPSENFTLAADVLVDAIRNPLFPADEIEKERGVIKEEINRKEDDPTGTLYEELFAAMFPYTPYAHPVLGTKESAEQITREDFANYLAKFYIPNNLTAVVVGDVDTKVAVAELERLTTGWESDPGVAGRKASFTVPDYEGVGEFSLEMDVNMSYVMLAFRTSGYGDERENATLDAVSSVMGEGRSSRLYRRIIEEERIASSVQAFIYPLTRTGLFIIMGTMEPEMVPRFREVVLEEIGKLRNQAIPADELNKVKTMLRADFQFANETDADIAMTLGHYHTLGRLDEVTEYERSINAVTIDEIRRYVIATLNPESYSFGVINPLSSERGGDVR